MENNLAYEAAKQRVATLKAFYQNLISYVAINVILFVINLITSPHHWWFIWPLLGWGVGVIAHGIQVFKEGSFLSKDWEERKIKEIMTKDK